MEVVLAAVKQNKDAFGLVRDPNLREYIRRMMHLRRVSATLRWTRVQDLLPSPVSPVFLALNNLRTPFIE